VLSVFGDHLADAMFMKRMPQSTLMEFFPPNEFNRDWETVVGSMGIRYVAWQGNQYVLITCLFFPYQSNPTTRKKIYGRGSAYVLTINDVRGFCVGRAGCRSRYHGRAQ
jgi:hypothetical protein